MTKPDWKVCLEIGLNHLGSYPLLEEMLRSSGIKELGAAVTVQIKEEEFYKNNKEYKLTLDEHNKFINLCKELKIPCGLALGPLSNLSVLKNAGLNPDFIKTLSISSKNKDFMCDLYDMYDCPKYLSIGLSDFSYISREIIPLMSSCDELIHTCLSHNSSDQNLGDISLLSNLGVPVCYGLHATDHELIYTAIGAGANRIFCYIGEKSLSLPDYDHALGMNEFVEYVQKIEKFYTSLNCSSEGSKSSKIEFIK
jgi:sialic acid synthase SpsE